MSARFAVAPLISHVWRSAAVGVLIGLAVLPALPVQADTPSLQDLAFHDLFQLPIGPKGLVPSPRLLQLNGRRVRMLGYRVQVAPEQALPHLLLLSPLPAQVGDEDDSLADDLPPQVVFVHGANLPNTPGLLQVQGRLELGAKDEADGHVSAVRILAERVEAVVSTEP